MGIGEALALELGEGADDGFGDGVALAAGFGEGAYGVADAVGVGRAVGVGDGDGVGVGALHSAKLDVRRKQVQPLGSGPGTSAMWSAFTSDANELRYGEDTADSGDDEIRREDEWIDHGRFHPGTKFGCASS